MIFQSKKQDEFAERKLANAYLVMTGPALPRPWLLVAGGEVLAKCSERAPLNALRSAIGLGEIECR